MVVIKLMALALLSRRRDAPPRENLTPFAPNGFTAFHQGAAIVFFAYIGFDAISTAAEETKIRSATCRSASSAASRSARSSTCVGFVLTGMVPY
jgi:APA family basic amino acid/polyamine antiporter